MSDINAPGTSPAQLVWRKSSRSNSEPNRCVEVADAGERIAARDSKNPTGSVLAFGSGTWTAFLNSAKSGGFDLS